MQGLNISRTISKGLSPYLIPKYLSETAAPRLTSYFQ